MRKKRSFIFSRLFFISVVISLLIFWGIKKVNFKDALFSFLNYSEISRNISIFKILPDDTKFIAFSGRFREFISAFRKNRALSGWSRLVSRSGKAGISGIMGGYLGFPMKEKDLLELLGKEAIFIEGNDGGKIAALETKIGFEAIKQLFSFIAGVKDGKFAVVESYKKRKISKIPGPGFPLYTVNMGKHSIFSNKREKLHGVLDATLDENEKRIHPFITKLLDMAGTNPYLAFGGSCFDDSFFPFLPPVKWWGGSLSFNSHILNFNFNFNFNFQGIPQSDPYYKAYKNHHPTFHNILKALPQETLIAVSSNAIVPIEIYQALNRNPHFEKKLNKIFSKHSSLKKDILPYIGPRFFYFCDGVDTDNPIPFLRHGGGIELHFKKDIKPNLNSLIKFYFDLNGDPVKGKKRGQEYFYFETESGLTPSYSFFGNILVCCLDKDSLFKLIDRRRGIGTDLSERPDFKKFFNILPAKYHYMFYMDLKNLWEQLKTNLELAQEVNNALMIAGLEDERLVFPKVLSLVQGAAGTLSVENKRAALQILVD